MKKSNCLKACLAASAILAAMSMSACSEDASGNHKIPDPPVCDDCKTCDDIQCPDGQSCLNAVC